MTTVRDSVLFYGKVEKIGTDGTILSRNIFVTPSALLVCLPAGGTTRSVLLSSILEIELSRHEVVDRPCCTIHVRDEASLTLRFESQSDADEFTDLVSKAATNVRVVNVPGKLPPEKHIKLDMPHVVPKGVRFAAPQELPESPSASSLAAVKDRWRRLSSPSSSVGPASRTSAQAATKPIEALEMAGLNSAVGLRANGGRDNAGDSDMLPEKHVSPFRRETFHDSHLMGSADGKARNLSGGSDLVLLKTDSLYAGDTTRPTTTLRSSTYGQSSPSQERGGRQHWHGESVNDLRAQRDSLASLQQRFSADLEMQKQAVSRLSGELQEKNAFIDDLKTALRLQEGVFQEMLKSTEQLRLMEKTKSQLEKQVEVLQMEVKHLESVSQQKESDHRKELATKLAELHEAHTKEVGEVQGAFAQYDAEMTEYVSGLLKERDREARRWGEQERRLQKQIEIQRHEIAELTSVLAARQAVLSDAEASSSSAAATAAAAAVSDETKETGRTAVVKGVDGLNGNLTASPLQNEHELSQPSWRSTPSAITMPQLELRLAALEEQRARLRLGEKLRHYAHRREYEVPGMSFGGHKSEEGQQEGDPLAAETAARLLSQRLQTPRATNGTRSEVSSMLLSSGGSRGVRNRAIL